MSDTVARIGLEAFLQFDESSIQAVQEQLTAGLGKLKGLDLGAYAESLQKTAESIKSVLTGVAADKTLGLLNTNIASAVTSLEKLIQLQAKVGKGRGSSNASTETARQSKEISKQAKTYKELAAQVKMTEQDARKYTAQVQRLIQAFQNGSTLFTGAKLSLGDIGARLGISAKAANLFARGLQNSSKVMSERVIATRKLTEANAGLVKVQERLNALNAEASTPADAKLQIANLMKQVQAATVTPAVARTNLAQIEASIAATAAKAAEVQAAIEGATVAVSKMNAEAKATVDMWESADKVVASLVARLKLTQAKEAVFGGGVARVKEQAAAVRSGMLETVSSLSQLLELSDRNQHKFVAPFEAMRKEADRVANDLNGLREILSRTPQDGKMLPLAKEALHDAQGELKQLLGGMKKLSGEFDKEINARGARALIVQINQARVGIDRLIASSRKESLGTAVERIQQQIAREREVLALGGRSASESKRNIDALQTTLKNVLRTFEAIRDAAGGAGLSRLFDLGETPASVLKMIRSNEELAASFSKIADARARIRAMAAAGPSTVESPTPQKILGLAGTQEADIANAVRAGVDPAVIAELKRGLYSAAESAKVFMSQFTALPEMVAQLGNLGKASHEVDSAFAGLVLRMNELESASLLSGQTSTLDSLRATSSAVEKLVQQVGFFRSSLSPQNQELASQFEVLSVAAKHAMERVTAAREALAKDTSSRVLQKDLHDAGIDLDATTTKLQKFHKSLGMMVGDEAIKRLKADFAALAAETKQLSGSQSFVELNQAAAKTQALIKLLKENYAGLGISAAEADVRVRKLNLDLLATQRAATKAESAGIGSRRFFSELFASFSGLLEHQIRFYGGMTLIFGVTRKVVDALKDFSAFSDVFRRIGIIASFDAANMDEFQEKIKGVRAELRELVRTTPVENATSTAEQFLEIVKAGSTVEDAMTTLKGAIQLSTVAGGGLKEAINAIVTIQKAWGIETDKMRSKIEVLNVALNLSRLDASDLSTIFNFLAASSAQAGLSFEDVALAISVLRNAGVKASQVGTGLSNFLITLQRGSNGLSQALEKIGLSIESIRPGPMRPLIETFRILSQSGRNTEEVFRALMQGLTLRSGRAANAFLSQMQRGVNGVEVLNDAIQRASAGTLSFSQTLEGQFVESTKSLQKQLQILNNKFQDLFKQILNSDNTMSLFVRGINAAFSALQKFLALFGKINDMTSGLLSLVLISVSILRFMASFERVRGLSVILGGFSLHINKLVGILSTFVSKMFSAALGAGSFMGALRLLKASFLALGSTTVFGTIIVALGALWAALSHFTPGFTQAIKNFFSRAFTTAGAATNEIKSLTDQTDLAIESLTKLTLLKPGTSLVAVVDVLDRIKDYADHPELYSPERLQQAMDAAQKILRMSGSTSQSALQSERMDLEKSISAEEMAKRSPKETDRLLAIQKTIDYATLRIALAQEDRRNGVKSRFTAISDEFFTKDIAKLEAEKTRISAHMDAYRDPIVAKLADIDRSLEGVKALPTIIQNLQGSMDRRTAVAEALGVSTPVATAMERVEKAVEDLGVTLPVGLTEHIASKGANLLQSRSDVLALVQDLSRSSPALEGKATVDNQTPDLTQEQIYNLSLIQSQRMAVAVLDRIGADLGRQASASGVTPADKALLTDEKENIAALSKALAAEAELRSEKIKEPNAAPKETKATLSDINAELKASISANEKNMIDALDSLTLAQLNAGEKRISDRIATDTELARAQLASGVVDLDKRVAEAKAIGRDIDRRVEAEKAIVRKEASKDQEKQGDLPQTLRAIESKGVADKARVTAELTPELARSAREVNDLLTATAVKASELHGLEKLRITDSKVLVDVKRELLGLELKSQQALLSAAALDPAHHTKEEADAIQARIAAIRGELASLKDEEQRAGERASVNRAKLREQMALSRLEAARMAGLSQEDLRPFEKHVIDARIANLQAERALLEQSMEPGDIKKLAMVNAEIEKLTGSLALAQTFATQFEDSMTTMQQVAQDTATAARDAWRDGFFDVMTGKFDNLKSVLNSFIAGVERRLSDFAADAAFKALFTGGQQGFGSSGSVSALKSVFSLFGGGKESPSSAPNVNFDISQLGNLAYRNDSRGGGGGGGSLSTLGSFGSFDGSTSSPAYPSGTPRYTLGFGSIGLGQSVGSATAAQQSPSVFSAFSAWNSSQSNAAAASFGNKIASTFASPEVANQIGAGFGRAFSGASVGAGLAGNEIGRGLLRRVPQGAASNIGGVIGAGVGGYFGGPLGAFVGGMGGQAVGGTFDKLLSGDFKTRDWVALALGGTLAVAMFGSKPKTAELKASADVMVERIGHSLVAGVQTAINDRRGMDDNTVSRLKDSISQSVKEMFAPILSFANALPVEMQDEFTTAISSVHWEFGGSGSEGDTSRAVKRATGELVKNYGKFYTGAGLETIRNALDQSMSSVAQADFGITDLVDRYVSTITAQTNVTDSDQAEQALTDAMSSTQSFFSQLTQFYQQFEQQVSSLVDDIKQYGQTGTDLIAGLNSEIATWLSNNPETVGRAKELLQANVDSYRAAFELSAGPDIISAGNVLKGALKDQLQLAGGASGITGAESQSLLDQYIADITDITTRQVDAATEQQDIAYDSLTELGRIKDATEAMANFMIFGSIPDVSTTTANATDTGRFTNGLPGANDASTGQFSTVSMPVHTSVNEQVPNATGTAPADNTSTSKVKTLLFSDAFTGKKFYATSVPDAEAQGLISPIGGPWGERIFASKIGWYTDSIAMAVHQNELNSMWRSYADAVRSLPAHFNGLDFVPRDNYPALLHYGEAVLTRSEADSRRAGNTNVDIKIGAPSVVIHGAGESAPELVRQALRQGTEEMTHELTRTLTTLGFNRS